MLLGESRLCAPAWWKRNVGYETDDVERNENTSRGVRSKLEIFEKLNGVFHKIL